ncbi:C-type lectin domain family 3 member A isoform X2 [Xenopus tropicalis]|uniref:C-type lectin domain family 3 member A isoform X2 n=1 Tax=Xenopus tropicalis TaxID=8364 RepID=A0A8J1JFJ1_XENTR|nr:C-type lectin domain family 3 member A isoform X2 [Xenopus tropicalis]
MGQAGLVICLFITIVLLDLTCTQPAKLKTRKDRRAKEKDGDLKTQIDKLWREVNSLKEMQALQTETKHFHEANEDCIAKGGTLAIPRDAEENNALRDYGKKSLRGSGEFWLGINDMVNEGKFVDVNGVAITYFNWERPPNGGKRKNCALLNQASQGKWVDEVCRSLKKYICEFIIP